MSVILAGMGIPNNCKECPLRYSGVKSYCEPLLGKPLIHDIFERRSAECPIKFIDGLIAKIMQLDAHDFCGYEGTHIAPLIDREEVIEIIKEYCGMEDK